MQLLNTMTGYIHPKRATFLAVAFAAIALIGAPAPAVHAQSPDMLMGKPSNATTDTANADNFLMIKPYFVLPS